MINARTQKSIRDLQSGLSFSIEGAEEEALDVLPDAGMSGDVEEAKPVRINIKRTIAAMQVAACKHTMCAHASGRYKKHFDAMHSATVAPPVKCLHGQLPERSV
jgi:hypothetical protein